MNNGGETRTETWTKKLWLWAQPFVSGRLAVTRRCLGERCRLSGIFPLAPVSPPLPSPPLPSSPPRSSTLPPSSFFELRVTWSGRCREEGQICARLPWLSVNERKWKLSEGEMKSKKKKKLLKMGGRKGSVSLFQKEEIWLCSRVRMRSN